MQKCCMKIVKIKKCPLFFFTFQRHLICQIVENYMESKNKTTPAVPIKQPLQYVGPHFLKKCVNDKEKQPRWCVFYYKKQVQNVRNFLSINVKHVTLDYVLTVSKNITHQNNSFFFFFFKTVVWI